MGGWWEGGQLVTEVGMQHGGLRTQILSAFTSILSGLSGKQAWSTWPSGLNNKGCLGVSNQQATWPGAGICWCYIYLLVTGCCCLSVAPSQVLCAGHLSRDLTCGADFAAASTHDHLVPFTTVTKWLAAAMLSMALIQQQLVVKQQQQLNSCQPWPSATRCPSR